MNILQFSAFTDNYIWAIKNKNHLLLVDPGDHRPIEHFFLQNPSCLLAGILITHHHNDHVGGILDLLDQPFLCDDSKILVNGIKCRSKVPVFGPPGCERFGVNTIVTEGDIIDWYDLTSKVLDIRGHTEEHLGYYCTTIEGDMPPFVFCGDTLFAGGCGRVLGGSVSDLFDSLVKLKSLPKKTLVYCAHEYTLNNLNFAVNIFPDDKEISKLKKNVEICRSRNISTVPSTIEVEIQTNPFYRCLELEQFKELRKMKDVWS